ncbi:endonuclease G, mitochondrial [Drosophila ficusphila]|uniref:endonuclease G, mitochondrial n=1 Tax=Drosophila ficusphila TaxID=30025 RepID=UPI0007E61FF1|nr:endonuclease G, mitochondrial [Drosophila ficusphila]
MDQMPVRGILGILATAGSFFALGAYYQHIDVMRNIRRLEQRNPHAYFIRRKLYGLLNIFTVRADSKEFSEEGDDCHKLGGIMKYGFPSTNDISLNETFDFVTSFDRRNSAVQWMCERVDISDRIIYGDPLSVTPVGAFGQSEASRVFFLSNIKPFLNRGFNMKVWDRLLQYVNEMSRRHGTVYVYTGSIYLPRELKSNNWFLEFQTEERTMVAVPTHFFKILVIDPRFEEDAIPYAEAYVMPNSPLNNNVDLKTLLSDIRDIENATGLRFFEGLDRNFVNTQVATSNPVNSPLANSANGPVAGTLENHGAVTSKISNKL